MQVTQIFLLPQMYVPQIQVPRYSNACSSMQVTQSSNACYSNVPQIQVPQILTLQVTRKHYIYIYIYLVPQQVTQGRITQIRVPVIGLETSLMRNGYSSVPRSSRLLKLGRTYMSSRTKTYYHGLFIFLFQTHFSLHR